MKAMVCDQYGPPEVLHAEEVERPVPKANEVLIKVHASSVTAGDYRTRDFDIPPGFRTPARIALGVTRPRHRILGTEVAGEVIEVGSKVSKFRVGDRVYGSDTHFGGYAEYVCRSADGGLAKMPENLSWEEAAAVPFGAQSALFFLRDLGHIEAGHRVLIYGASGGVGTAAVQLAKHFGAEVTGVCSTANLDLVRSLGADHVIDYTREDYAENGKTYDLILDTVGKTSFAHCKGSLTPHGIYLPVAGGIQEYLQRVWTAMSRGKRVRCSVAQESGDDLAFIRDVVEAGKYRPAIDRTYPLEQVAEAHAYAEKGHKRGNVVISVA